jgi:hypothetical protein
MKINHEETKKEQEKNLRALRCFVVDSLRSFHIAWRRPETMKTRLEFRLQAGGVECNPFGHMRKNPPKGGTPNIF